MRVFRFTPNPRARRYTRMPTSAAFSSTCVHWHAGERARTWCRSAAGVREPRGGGDQPRAQEPPYRGRLQVAVERAELSLAPPERRVQSALGEGVVSANDGIGYGPTYAPTARPRVVGAEDESSSIGACPRPAPRRLIPRRMHPRDGVAPASMRERRVEAGCRKIVRGLLMTNDGSLNREDDLRNDEKSRVTG